MDKKVIVTIKSKQTVDGEEENIELITAGKFYKKENAYYIVYEETEIPGMEGTTTTVKVGDGEINLIRFGTTDTRLNFKKGTRDVCLYKTPYGILELVINPYLVKINMGDTGGELRLGYELSAGGQRPSTNELYIKVQEGH